MPSPIASPCSSRSEKPAAASNAWPKVWPRLSSIRSPVSRSSRATIAALARQLTAMACSRARPAGEQVAPVGVEPLEETRVAQQAVFHHLGIAGAEFALRQRVEQRGVGHHQDRLIERADQILALAGVDRGLTADRGIDLRQQRGRHLHVIDAAANDRGGKAAEIADHAAAQRHDDIAALDLCRQQRVADALEMRKLLLLSPAGTLTDDTPMPAPVSEASAAAR